MFITFFSVCLLIILKESLICPSKRNGDMYKIAQLHYRYLNIAGDTACIPVVFQLFLLGK